MTNVMKKVIACSCAAVLALSFAACSGGTDEPTTEAGGTAVGSSLEEVVAEYITAYDKTKGSASNIKGSDSLEIVDGSLKLSGSSNAMLDNIVAPLIGQVFQSATDKNLPPNGGDDFMKSKLTAADVLTATKEETATSIILKITPKDSNMSSIGKDEQGRFFDTLGDIGKVVTDLGVKWASGTLEDNCKVIYSGGTGVITIDKTSGMITNAVYSMLVNVHVTHASLSLLSDKEVAATIKYVQTFPAVA